MLTFHVGFKLQSTILKLMFTAVESGAVKVRLWDPATIPDPTMTNQRFLREYIARFLQFPNMSSQQIQVFVAGLFDLSKDLPSFKQHLRLFPHAHHPFPPPFLWFSCS
jgi:exportin-1